MKVSIITATFNSEVYIRNCLNSLIMQSYDNFELIVIDGGSTDNTLNILSEYSSYISVLKSEKDKGIYDALNKGVVLASGDIVGVLHSDDQFYDSHVLKNIVNTFKEINTDVVYGDLVYHYNDKIVRYWRSKKFENKFLKHGWMPPHPTIFCKKNVLISNSYSLLYKISSDYDFILRVFMSNNYSFTYLPKVITKMRVGGISNGSIKNILRKTIEDYKCAHRNGFGIFYSFQCVLFKNLTKLRQFF